MAPRPKYQRRLDDAVDRAVDLGIDALFEKATDFFSRGMDAQRASMQQIPPAQRRAVYKCAGCHNPFPFEALAMVSAKDDGYGTCEQCFRFMWNAGNEKMRALQAGVSDWAKGAARAGQRPAPGPAPAEPKGRKPWEVLGVDANASVEEIKKAYRKLAGAAHPDRVAPGSPSSEVEAARALFEEIDRAYKVMMRVRSPAT